jgi:hypothetical protein
MTNDEAFKIIEEMCLKVLRNSDQYLAGVNWGNDDIRRTFYGKFNGVVLAAYLGMRHVHYHLSQKDWWQTQFRGTLSALSQHGQEGMLCYEGMIRKGLIVNTGGVFESTARLLIRKISPGRCDDGKAEYKSIYQHLLKKLDLSTNCPSLEMARMSRNAMLHNDGVYVHKKDLSATVDYKGVRYEFKPEFPVSGINWSVICNIVQDIQDLTTEMFNHEMVIQVNHIPDPQKITQQG